MLRHDRRGARLAVPSRRRLCAVAAALAIAGAVSACGGGKATSSPTTATTPTTASVGAGGGKVEVPGSAAVQLPGGAVTQDTTVGVAVVEPPAPLPSPAVSGVVELTPHGARFAEPVTIALRYSGVSDTSRLSVVRLADPQATSWQVVGGAKFSGGVATFESTTFSYYAVVNGFQCSAASDAVACGAGCECCGTATCVDVTSDPRNCGGCGKACGADAFCANDLKGAARCVPVAKAKLCENAKLYSILGELPSDIVVVSPEETRDWVYAKQVGDAVSARCGVPVTTVSQAQAGILDACTNAPLLKGGTTILVVGGPFGQRLARYLDLGPAPVALTTNAGTWTFRTRAGTDVVTFKDADINPRHDYFVVSLVPDPNRGALVLYVYGVGWEGTPAATWYFIQRLLPDVFAATRTWQRYQVVEWTDDGDGVKGATDTFKVLAQDVP